PPVTLTFPSRRSSDLLVTDRSRLAGVADFEAVRRCLATQCRFAVDAGVDLIQVRERDLEGKDLAALVGEVIQLARGSRTRVVVKDRKSTRLNSSHGSI